MSGIHHITLITGNVQANVDFYAGFLGMRLVKRTGGYEDATQLHLFYGDGTGSPGTLLTFFVWEAGSPGRVGHGQVSEIALAIDLASIGFWLTRALSRNMRISGPAQEFGEPVLRLTDPDGIAVKLVGVAGAVPRSPWASEGVPEEHAIRHIRAATILTEKPQETEDFLAAHFGYRFAGRNESIRRMAGDGGDAIDIRDARGFWTSAPGTGTVDHVAFRAADLGAVEKLFDELRGSDAVVTDVHDRKYFHSIYVREPNGVLLELATDAPGMMVDEPYETLGTKLWVPPSLGNQAEDIKTMLPQFAMPGEERIVYRELPFVHRFYVPDNPDGSVLVLLHGSGGNEASLMPLAARMAPRAKLLGVRGRATEEGMPRWFRRYSPTTFDQKDVAFEAEAFAAFVAQATEAYDLPRAATAFVGYSNGANLLAALMTLKPGVVDKAVLMRAMPVLDNPAHADLTGTEVLMIAGREDQLYASYSEGLKQMLASRGATVEAHVVEATHELGEADVELARQWLEPRLRPVPTSRERFDGFRPA